MNTSDSRSISILSRWVSAAFAGAGETVPAAMTAARTQLEFRNNISSFGFGLSGTWRPGAGRCRGRHDVAATGGDRRTLTVPIELAGWRSRRIRRVHHVEVVGLVEVKFALCAACTRPLPVQRWVESTGTQVAVRAHFAFDLLLIEIARTLGDGHQLGTGGRR